MNKLFNPFRYLAGSKAMVLGIIFIISSACLLYAGGMVQDSYVHIAMYRVAWWQTLLIQVVWWIIPAILYYTYGLFMSRSNIRIIDVLGTTAFAQLLYIPMVVPMLFPFVQEATSLTLQAVQQGVQPAISNLITIMMMGVWTMLFLALYFVWNYKAFSVSCNVRGAKAIIYFIAVQVIMTVAGNIF